MKIRERTPNPNVGQANFPRCRGVLPVRAARGAIAN
jgi:hypothetical protein